jgi:hypothetical protein
LESAAGNSGPECPFIPIRKNYKKQNFFMKFNYENEFQSGLQIQDFANEAAEKGKSGSGPDFNEQWSA